MIKKKHQQLSDILEEALRNGVYPPSSKLPSIRELSEKYDVSFNIATEAVGLLKEKGLVTAKAGDGIYATIDGSETVKRRTFSGARVFAYYPTAKRLNLILEDKWDWQLAFWNETFDSFVKMNPDVELAVDYSYGTAPSASYDLRIGGIHFLNKSGARQSNLMEASQLAYFQPDLHKDTVLKPNHLRWSGACRLLPVAFKIPRVFTLLQSEARADENALEFVERIAAESGGVPVGYKVLVILQFLMNAGCRFFDYDAGGFRIHDHDKCLAIFKRVKKLCDRKDLLILHGQFADPERLFVRGRNNPVRFAELSFPLKDDAAERRNAHEIPYPFHGDLPYVPIVAAVSSATLFPEEVSRLVAHLASRDVQRKMLALGIALPIHKEALAEGGLSPLAERMSFSIPSYLAVPSLEIMNAVNYFLIWDFHYYLNGRIGEDVLGRVEKKIEHYLRGVYANEK